MSDAVPLVTAFEAVAAVHALPVGSLKAVVLTSGDKVCLVHTASGFYAVADRCSHRDFPLSAGEVTVDGLVECAWHGAQFDPQTGIMLTGPGGDDIRTYAVRVEDDLIMIALTSTSP
mgnify:CR=1 FL=1